MRNPDTAPTIQERLDAGEVRWLTNVAQFTVPDGSRDRYVENLREEYGDENVIVTNAIDQEGQTSGIPGMVGVYVVNPQEEQQS